MKTIRPITDLRKTNEMSEICHQSDEPIFITKNGYGDLVLMSQECYERKVKAKEPIRGNSEKKRSYCDLLQKQNEDHALIKVAAVTNDVIIANVKANTENILQIIEQLNDKQVDIIVFPELALTGYSCGDLFYQNSLLDSVYQNINILSEKTKGIKSLLFIGTPLQHENKLYNCALVMADGQILGVVPKTFLPSYNEFYEKRQFVEFRGENQKIQINGVYYPFGSKLIFVNEHQRKLKVACEICEDIWAAKTPSTAHALMGATIIANLSASNETIGKEDIRRDLVSSTSKRLLCGYVYASAGNGESTTDVVFSSHNIIAECGQIIQESPLFNNRAAITEIDLDIIESERRIRSSFEPINDEGYEFVSYRYQHDSFPPTRLFSLQPFVDLCKNNYQRVIEIQAMGLVKRLQHIHCHNVVLGLSGGLDSTLALLVCVKAFEILKYEQSGIHTLLLPCFGTSDRTYQNALKLADHFQTTKKEISIQKAVLQHLEDLQHDSSQTDIVYENAQARERTQVLFDYANQINGIVIGTGDLSELALGWCTFNGDQMANYSVNGSVSKTMVQFLVASYAKDHPIIRSILEDVLATPISPELLPTNDNQIAQMTEDAIGPYELHDFFLFYLLRYHMSAKKIFFLACEAFKGKYPEAIIRKWLKKFLSRFFSQQFKRSTLPDGVKATYLSISPRGDFRMPSDASANEFLDF